MKNKRAIIITVAQKAGVPFLFNNPNQISCKTAKKTFPKEYKMDLL